MESLTHVASLLAIGAVLASPWLLPQVVVEWRKTKRWAHVVKLQAEIEAEIASAFEHAERRSFALDDHEARAERDREAAKLRALSIRLKSGVARSLRSVVAQ